MYFSTRSGRNQIEQIYQTTLSLSQSCSLICFFIRLHYILGLHTQPKVLLIGILGVIHRRWGQPRSNMLVKFYVHTYLYTYIRTYPYHQTKVCEDACGGGKFHKNCWVLNCAMCAVQRSFGFKIQCFELRVFDIWIHSIAIFAS